MTKIIQLTQGKVTLVSDEDYAWLAEYSWTYQHDNYATHYYRVGAKVKAICLQNLIMNPPLGYVADHIDGNGLNNQRNNLRVCTPLQNRWNRRPNKGQRYKGAYLKSHGRWYARIQVCGEAMHLGTYDTEEEAAHAYDKAAQKHFGEYAYLNFPGNI